MTTEGSDDWDRHLRALGWLVESSALLDYVAFQFMVARAGIPLRTANVLMGRDPFTATIARLGRLVEAATLPPSVKDAFRRWGKDANNAMERRNEFVHSAWVAPGHTGAALDRLVRHREPVDALRAAATEISDVEALAGEIDALVGRLVEMAGDLGVLASGPA